MTQDLQTHEPLLALHDVAQRLNISDRTVHNLLDSGELEGMKIANRWRFTEQMVLDYLERARRKEGKGAKKKRAYHRKQLAV